MTEAEEVKLAAARDASEEIPAWADALGKKMDSIHSEVKDAHKRLDSFEGADAKKDEEKAEKDRKDAEEKEKAEKDKKDAEEDTEAEKKDKAKRDSEEKEREERAKKDAATLTDNRKLAAEIAEMKAKMGNLYTEPSFEDRNALAQARSRADSLYQALTGQNASQPLPGEPPMTYRKRLADGLRKYSETFKDERLEPLTGNVFDHVEERIYSDAKDAIRAPGISQGGELRAITTEGNGRTVVEYVGDPKVAWYPFQAGTGMSAKLTRPEK